MADRVAVVVGGGSGIGAAAVAALGRDGYRVTVADRDLDAAQTVAEALGDPHVPALVEVTDEMSVAALLDGVVGREGRLDAAVNCAGISGFGAIVHLDVEDFRRVVDVDLTGGFLVIKHAARRIADGGSIVTVASLNARQPGAGLAAYCAAKAGLVMLTQVAALELGGRGIRVNAVSPGLVPTPLTKPGLEIPGVQDDYLDNTPLGRPGTPDEIAGAIRFLCSSEAAWMTGEVLDLNGGAHLRRYPDLLTHITRAFA